MQSRGSGEFKALNLSRGIVNCRRSGFSSGTACIKSSCNLTGKRFKTATITNRQPYIPPIEKQKLTLSNN